MSVEDKIALYAEGWTVGDVDKIMAGASPEAALHDPNVGRIAYDGLRAYAEGLIATVAQMRGGAAADKLMEMTDVVIKDGETPVTVWAWFTVPGAPLAGAAVMKFDDRGLIEERIAYAAKPAV